MCGIIGFAGDRSAASVLLEGLERLEYRGYDSAGIAVLDPSPRRLEVRRTVGPVDGLARLLEDDPVDGRVGIGHTRWATHGTPTVHNAHPHLDCSGEIAIVHNGTLDDYLQISQELLARGHTLRSDTDSELIAHLIEESRQAPDDPEDLVSAVREALTRISGGIALVAMSAAHGDVLVAARRGRAGSLVVVGGADFVAVASDTVAVSGLGDVASVIDRDHMAVLAPGVREYRRIHDNLRADPVDVPVPESESRRDSGPSRSSMFLAEIHDQPRAMAACTSEFTAALSSGGAVVAPIQAGGTDLTAFRDVRLLACGTPLHACLVGRTFIEDIAGVPATAEFSHEFIGRERPLVGADTLVVAVSQSGETADTVLALERAMDLGATTIAVTNVEGSTAARQADGRWFMRCGPEYSVAQTKAFTSELCVLLMLATALGSARGALTTALRTAVADELRALPERIAWILAQGRREYLRLATDYLDEHSFLFLGRGHQYPIAVEGALKLKELSYVHAEGYPAGEMKHGPIALVRPGYPVVAIITADRTRPKMFAQLSQLKARGARVIAVAEDGDTEVERLVDDVLWIPAGPTWTAPMTAIVPLQLLACVFAEIRGRNVDRPRNLAKSVTVE